jgi:hypothetical protein
MYPVITQDILGVRMQDMRAPYFPIYIKSILGDDNSRGIKNYWRNSQMKKLSAVLLSATLLLSFASAASAAPAHQTKAHEHKAHEQKMHMHKEKAAKHKVHAKSIKAKSIKTKATEMPRTGFGGASEQTE